MNWPELTGADYVKSSIHLAVPTASRTVAHVTRGALG
jgi:hypothetical protein